MMLNAWQRQDLLKRRFTLPNELFSLGLTTAEISIYTYLLYIEDRKTHQCWPSYKTIGKAVKLSIKTVKKYVAELVDKGLISTENTTVITKKGIKRNGSLFGKFNFISVYIYTKPFNIIRVCTFVLN